MWRTWVLAAAAALAASGQDRYPIAAIQVEGASRIPAGAVLRASGLSLNQPVVPADLQAACERLAATGIIESARYRYKAAAGAQRAYDVTLSVTEAGELREVRIDIPGVDAAQAWQWFEQIDPLVRPQMPSNALATGYYTRAMERYLEARGRPAQVLARFRTDPGTAEVVAIFRPAVLGKIADVNFEGNSAVASDALEKAIAPAIGTEYTDQDFRELLDLNVRPLYEEQGRYAVQYPRITNDGGVVTVMIKEGPVFRLGAVQVAGDNLAVAVEELARLADLKPGEPPSARKLAQAASAIQAALGRFGYLDASCEIDRHLDEQAGRIDVVYSVLKGPRYTFGELRLVGLEPQSEARARSLWKLAPGAVVNLAWLDEYEKLLMRDDKIRFQRISRRHDPRPGTTTVDVTFTFRR